MLDSKSPDSKSPDFKSYVIGIIEIDPIAECERTWLRLAGDDETLDAVLARLARHVPRGERYQPKIRAVGQGRAPVSAERVVANLTELSSDLAERLAEIRERLAAG